MPAGPYQKRVNLPEIVSALVILALAAVAFVDAAKLPFGSLSAPDAVFIPVIEASLFACAGLALLASARTTRKSSISWPASDGRQIMLCLSIALVAYVVVLPILGFSISTMLFLWAAIGSWRYYSILISAVMALVMTSGLYVLFVAVLRMSLPHSFLISF